MKSIEEIIIEETPKGPEEVVKMVLREYGHPGHSTHHGNNFRFDLHVGSNSSPLIVHSDSRSPLRSGQAVVVYTRNGKTHHYRCQQRGYDWEIQTPRTVKH
jgi:hypothetical protein